MTRFCDVSPLPTRRADLRKALSAMAAVFLFAVGAHAEQVVQNPHYGPYTQSIASVATWQVSQGYLALDPADTTRLMEKLQNPGVTGAWLYGPEKLEPWFAIIDYEQTGHVKDDEKIDAAAIMDQLKRGNEVANEQRRQRGWPDLNIVGWQVAPHYEPDTKRLAWATLVDENGRTAVNYTTKLLARTGVATVVLVTDVANLDRSVAELKAKLDGFSFNPDQTYYAFRSGDKIAEYGLTGLIVGGAAAAAVKTGAWKWLVGILAAGWKFIGAAILAALAGLRSLFTRRKA